MANRRTVQYKTAGRILAALVAAAILVMCGGSNNDQPPQASSNPQVRQLGLIDSIIAADITQQVKMVPFTLRQDSPIVLQGRMMSTLPQSHNDELKATYRAGHAIVLLDATMEDIAALHGIIGAGITYDSKDAGGVLAYSVRQENRIPVTTLLSQVNLSPLRTAKGEPDPTGLQDNKQAHKKAVELTVAELSRLPATSSRALQGTNQNVDWKTTPVQTTTFQQNSASGVYNTTVNVYALHSCAMDVRTGLTSDYYMVTALADWTATNAKFQSAATELGSTSMYLDQDRDEYVVVNWQDDPQRNYCSSPSSWSNNADICRYINYPLQYSVEMVPLNGGSIAQTNAKPPAQQGQATTYTSGFSFTLGGMVIVNGMGPGAGLSTGVTWNNTTQTTVAPVELELSQTTNQGAMWTYRYCTGGEEPDAGGNCTSHVQTAKDVCRAQLGDNTGTNPQQGQRPVGAFTDAVHTALWQAGPDTRVGKSTFDIQVTVTPTIGNTTANLWGASGFDNNHAGCDPDNCDCVSTTTKTPLTGGSYVFKIPLPPATCQQGVVAQSR
ncbi:hypothetical protein [Noviherbaspirillum galbum]|uniref:Uncharacterized protein n=1 Tax=Noviherbaspirillum galbum TaxID=2709383 RepID=A0A6B3SZU1_9BURK|nr:hypothetical protein [Noviherbaspirillum galbum]NEX64629.1 hypothetical protein [Noviherbaspirillum galbum]